MKKIHNIWTLPEINHFKRLGRLYLDRRVHHDENRTRFEKELGEHHPKTIRSNDLWNKAYEADMKLASKYLRGLCIFPGSLDELNLATGGNFKSVLLTGSDHIVQITPGNYDEKISAIEYESWPETDELLDLGIVGIVRAQCVPTGLSVKVYDEEQEIKNCYLGLGFTYVVKR